MQKNKMFKKARARYMSEKALMPAKNFIRIFLTLLTAAIFLLYI